MRAVLAFVFFCSIYGCVSGIRWLWKQRLMTTKTGFIMTLFCLFGMVIPLVNTLTWLGMLQYRWQVAMNRRRSSSLKVVNEHG